MEQWRLLEIDNLTYAETAILRPVLMRARAEDIIPDTVSICTFSKPSAVIAYFNDPEKEINLDFCRQNAIPVNRVISIGGPIFGDIGYMHAMLIVGRKNPKIPENQTKMLEKTLPGIAVGISDYFEVECRFKPINDLEIKCEDNIWRKIGPSGALYEDKVIQMTTAMQVKKNDADLIASIITPPKEKFLDKQTKTLQDRITYLEKMVGRNIDFKEMKMIYKNQIEKLFQVELTPGKLTQKEENYFKEMGKKYTSDDFFMERSERRFGKISPGVRRKMIQFKIPQGPFVRIIVLTQDDIIRDIMFTGTIHASPLRPTSPIYEIEKALKDQRVDQDLFELIIAQIMSHPNYDIPKLSSKVLAGKIYECANQ